jgi:DNA-binding IclR family transcriptional regulator
MSRPDVAMEPKPHTTDRASVTGTQSVYRALSILHEFSPSRTGVTGSEIADSFGYSLPTAHRLLRALEAERFLVFDRASRRYFPGPEILRLSGVILDRDNGVPLTLSALERLRDATGETATLFWRLGDERTCVQEKASRHTLRLTPGLGRRYPLTRGAAGKALLLTEDEQAGRDLLRDQGTLQTPDADTLLAELDGSRERGYALSSGETIEGAVSIAAPILGIRRGLAAISITGPAERFDISVAKATGAVLIEEITGLQAAIHT